MGWFKKKKDKGESKDFGRFLPMPTYGRSNPAFANGGQSRGVDWTANLPSEVMYKIFGYVCPHSMDESYDSCEHSALEDCCMLCDMRDLANCVKVSKRWRKYSVPVLYRSIRIDAVHYCEREEYLTEKRRKGRNTEPEDTGATRMRLLCRTLRDDNLGLAACVLMLKTPYMTRETCKADLARICAVTPNLRYADFPDGFFSSDPSCNTLRQEVEINCHDIRKMSYNRGSEKAMERLASGSVWANLEVLEVTKLNMDPSHLRFVFGALKNLQALKVINVPAFTDQMFAASSSLPPFPPLKELMLENIRGLTVRGLTSYLSKPDVSKNMRTLCLENTSINAWDLQSVLNAAKRLTLLSIIETVSTPFPAHLPIPPLASKSLGVLHFEITADEKDTYTAGVPSYYSYLTTSLLSNTLPSLRQLYVRDVSFAETLVAFSLPKPGFMGDLPSTNPFAPKGTPSSTDNRFSFASGASQYGSPPSTSQTRFGSSPNSPPQFSPSSFSPPGKGRGISAIPEKASTQQQGLQYPLQIFTKGLDEMEWNFSHVDPASHNRRGSMTAPRPISSYGLEAAGGRMSGVWGSSASGARSSVIVGNGFGGFVQVPVDEKSDFSKGKKGGILGGMGLGKKKEEEVDEWPMALAPPPKIGSGTGNKRESKYDIWR